MLCELEAMSDEEAEKLSAEMEMERDEAAGGDTPE